MQIVTDTVKAFESFVGVNVWTMLFAWINLLILYIFLRKFLFKPIKRMIDARQKEVDDMYSNAESAEASANQLKAEYEEKINHANEQSEEILRSAVRRAELREEQILKEADAKAARTLKRAEEEIELEKKRAVNEVKDEVSDMAISIARAVLEKDINADDHKELIDEFIDKMGEAK